MVDKKEVKDEEWDDVVERLNKKHGDDFVKNSLTHAHLLSVEYQPTGIDLLDKALADRSGKGGWAKKHGTILWGEPGIGKSMLALTSAKEVLKAGKRVIYIAAETEEIEEPLSIVGIGKNEMFHLIHPNGTLETIIDLFYEILKNPKTGKLRDDIGMIVFDSINATVTSSEMATFLKEGADKDGQMARKAAILTKMVDIISSQKLIDNGVVLLMIAQARANIGGMGADIKLAAPYALQHYVKVICNLKKGKSIQGSSTIKAGGIKHNKLGHAVRVLIEKNNHNGRPGLEVEYTVKYGIGIDDSQQVVSKLEEYGYILTVSKGIYKIPTSKGDVTFKGKKTILDRAKVDPDFLDLLKEITDGPKPTASMVIEPKGFDYVLPELDAEDETE